MGRVPVENLLRLSEELIQASPAWIVSFVTFERIDDALEISSAIGD